MKNVETLYTSIGHQDDVQLTWSFQALITCNLAVINNKNDINIFSSHGFNSVLYHCVSIDLQMMEKKDFSASFHFL